MKVNNSSSFLGYSQRTGRDFLGSYRWHHEINSSNQYVLGRGAVHLGKRPEHEAKLQGTMGQRQTRQDRPSGTLCRKIRSPLPAPELPVKGDFYYYSISWFILPEWHVERRLFTCQFNQFLWLLDIAASKHKVEKQMLKLGLFFQEDDESFYRQK